MKLKPINPNYEPYHEEEDKFLRDHADDMTLKEIAESISRSVQSVRCRMQKLGIKRKFASRWLDLDERMTIERLAREGVCASDIAEALGRSRYTINTYIRNNNIHIWKKVK